MRWTRPLAALALTPVVATLLAVVPATGADAAPDDLGRYVAFGDSFVSGPGIADMRPGDCERSTHNFPSLVAAKIPLTGFTDASCGGATIGDLWDAKRDNPPQLDALTPDTGLVTFGTLGGNDVGLVSRAASCLAADCTGTPDDQYHQSIDATLPRLIEGIEETKLRAPNALIAVVGYGTYLPPGGCPDNPALPGFTASEADYIQGLIDHLSDVLAEAAAAEDVLFVDMREIPGNLDHTVCAAPDQQWIRALNPYGDGAPLHPSAAGQAAMAGQVMKVLKPYLPAGDPSVGPLAVTASCHAGDLRVRVRGGGNPISKVVFRLGSQRLGVDLRPPWVLERRARGLAGMPGRLTAAVVMRGAGSSLTLRTSVPRPRCLR